MDTSDEMILAISWNIATDPQLYRELAPNPYSPQALQMISKRFPDVSTFDIIRAVVLAEPEGKYDRNFRLLETRDQEKELHKQKDITKKIQKRLAQYYKKHRKELNLLSQELIYDCLSLVVFETDDIWEEEKKYAQNQRRDLKLAINNIIMDSQNPEQSLILKRQLLKTIVLTLLFHTLLFVSAHSLYLRYIEQKSQRIPSKGSQTLATSAQKDRQALPVRLKIPKLHIDTVIEYVGITPDGTMGIPEDTDNVGWFALGPRPGEIGSAVIGGHFDNENGNLGIFTNLDKLKKGDTLYTEDSRGIATFFTVRESRTYNPGYQREVFVPNDIAHLNLITCDGVWDGVKKSYSKRLVVFADMLQ